MTIPKRPIRRKIKGLPAFTTAKGGDYSFLPGIKALQYLATVGRREELTPILPQLGMLPRQMSSGQSKPRASAPRSAEARERLAIGDWPLRIMRLAEPLPAFRPARYARRFRRSVRIQF